MEIIRRVVGALPTLSIKRMSDFIFLLYGVFLLLYSVYVSVFRLQSDTLPHVESLTSVVTCTMLQSVIVVTSSLFQILQRTYSDVTSVSFHSFVLIVILMVSLTHSVVIGVSIHNFNRISDTNSNIPDIEQQYSCCGWYSISTRRCKSLAGLRMDRTCYGSVGTDVWSVLPVAMGINIILIGLAIVKFGIIYFNAMNENKAEMLVNKNEDTEDAVDVVNYLQVDEIEESIFDDFGDHLKNNDVLHNETTNGKGKSESSEITAERMNSAVEEEDFILQNDTTEKRVERF
ncbi:hypothetical protein EIN_164970 [Entamoeba invadens IP1]|uniref:Uncharacterized protein n=1 Tax=Entamoeba invadens IP1 TaxID=370355 RepID=A0A0A1U4A9_ENTIV|nr:hypothetical protein EIN_164970 [Entamoeba invadens IP1]ELP89057.1 hypothetical protein EIN_164970 [Entamoeba invadens IP1]|eukprot:XP_004255828.1 hypothetical protein EIN_164970 [Entamoeba invadens IP1]